MPDFEIICGDALTVLPTLEPGSFGAVVTDPPYNSGGRTPAERTTQSARSKYVTGSAGDLETEYPDFAGDNRDQRSFGLWLSLVLGECLRLAQPGASCLVFSDWRQLPTTTDAVQVAGWTWRGIVPWRKPLTRPIAHGFKRECEYVVWASNGPLVRHDPPIHLPGHLEASQPRGTNRAHITQKPLAILKELVRICPAGQMVLDPFAGSGTTGIAAVAEGRGFVGVEVTQHYAAIARQRISHTMTEIEIGADEAA